MKFLIAFLTLTCAINLLHGICNTCSTSGHACVSRTEFQLCTNNLTQGTIYPCPTGTICTQDAPICGDVGSVTAGCDMCLTCNAAQSFACTGYNTFALCHGTSVPNTTTVYTCAANLVCNIDSVNICVTSAVGLGASCDLPTTTPTPTTTPNPLTSPAAFCAAQNVVGRYKISSDTTCRQYIYCQLLNSAWIGNIYTCPGSLYFDSTPALCIATKPIGCA